MVFGDIGLQQIDGGKVFGIPKIDNYFM